jgi:hypothetical protein
MDQPEPQDRDTPAVDTSAAFTIWDQLEAVAIAAEVPERILELALDYARSRRR